MMSTASLELGGRGTHFGRTAWRVYICGRRVRRYRDRRNDGSDFFGDLRRRPRGCCWCRTGGHSTSLRCLHCTCSTLGSSDDCPAADKQGKGDDQDYS